MSNIPDKCSRCGAPIDWEKGAYSTKCSFCGKTNYLKNNFLNQFKSNLTFKNIKTILLNPVSIILIILLPVVFTRLIIQANKYKRFASAYLAEKACEEDESKLRAKKLKVRCDYKEKNTVQLISYENKVINFKLSGKTKKNIENNFLKSTINKSDKEVKNIGYCKYSQDKKSNGALHEKFLSQINKFNSDQKNYRPQLGYSRPISPLLFPYREEARKFYYKRYNLIAAGYPLDPTGNKIYEKDRPTWNPHDLLPRLQNKYPHYQNYDPQGYLNFYSEMNTIRKIKIDWLENFITEKNKEFAWNLVRLHNSKESKDCLERLRRNDIGNLISMIEKSPAMKKCDKELTKQEKLFISKDNYRSSVNCVHPYLGKSMSKYSGSVFPEFETNFTNLKELKEDIKLKVEKTFIKKYYLY